MLMNLDRRMLACIMFLAGFVLLQPDISSALPEGQLSEKPIAISYAKDMNEKRIAAYTTNLCERMNFGESIRRAVARELDTQEPDPIVQDSFDRYLL